MFQGAIQFLLVAELALSLFIIVFTLERYKSERRFGFVYSVTAVFLYTLGYFIETTCGNLENGIIALKIMNSGAVFFPPFFLIFTAGYCGTRSIKKIYSVFLLIAPLLFFVLLLTFDSHSLLFSDYDYDPFKPIMGMVTEPGPFYRPMVFYSLFCIVVSCIIIVRRIITLKGPGRFNFILLLLSAAAPAIAFLANWVFYLFLAFDLAEINLVSFLPAILIFMFFLSVMRNNSFDFASGSPDLVMNIFDIIPDAFIILDRDLAYVESNKEAKELFPALALLDTGSSLQELEKWPEELNPANEGKEIGFTLRHRPGKTYSGQIYRPASAPGEDFGRLILIRDISGIARLRQSSRIIQEEISILKDNLKEGVFILNDEYRIQDSFSKAVREILSVNVLNGRKFMDLLSASYNPRQIAIITQYFDAIKKNPNNFKALKKKSPLAEFLYTSTETGGKKILQCQFIPMEREGGHVFLMGIILEKKREPDGSRM